MALLGGFAVTGCDSGGGGDDSTPASTANADENDSGGGTNGSSGNGTGFDGQAMLENLATNVMTPTFEGFETASADLAGSVAQYCTALEEADSAPMARSAAQDAWKEAMRHWQHAEVMQVGPLAENSSALRDTIYSWPFTNTCAVDQEVINAEAADYSIADRTVERRGLDALEYLLFTEDLNHTCAPNIEATEGWNDRPDAERREVRCAFADAVARDLRDQADTLQGEWEAFAADELTDPGGPDSRFNSASEAINAVSDALFYIEDKTKDVKLQKPLGIRTRNSCDGEICPADVESPYSRTSKANLRYNFLAFQELFLGNEPGAIDAPRPGFDDFLDQSEENVSAGMRDAIEAAVLSVSEPNLPGTLYDALEENPSLVQSAQDAAKQVTDQLKADFVEVLGLEIPTSAAGDGD
jgi:predicted lipoprotein